MYFIFNYCFSYILKSKFIIFTIEHDETISSNTSIAFYIIATIKQKFNPDLRGHFWEPHLPKFRFKYSLQYVSDGNFTVNGVKFKIYGKYPLDINQTIEDRRECKRVISSWEDFIENNSDKKWFFKGGHDTYVNIAELLKLITKLEEKGDPMKTYNFAYIIHYYNKIAYPQGGAGFLASNYAMHQFVLNKEKFNEFCMKSYDDVALGLFLPSLNISLYDYETDKFVVSWPDQSYFMIKNNKTLKLKKCPINGSKFPKENFRMINSHTSNSASIHFHHLPMQIAADVISSTPEDVGIYWKRGYRAQFCSFDLNKTKYLHYDIKYL